MNNLFFARGMKYFFKKNYFVSENVFWTKKRHVLLAEVTLFLCVVCAQFNYQVFDRTRSQATFESPHNVPTHAGVGAQWTIFFYKE